MRAQIPSLSDRLTWLRAFRDAVRESHPTLCGLASEEIGKTTFEAMVADVMPLVASMGWHLRRAKSILGPRRVGGGGLFGFGHAVERHRLPVGRVLIIATWNYPVQLVGIQLVQAVLAGNAVVVKPSERAPRTQAALLDLAIRAADAIPSMRGSIEVRSASREEGRRVLAEERFDHVVFTGSTAVGRAIAEVCAQRLIPTTLELSGSDSAIVLDDADAVAAARAVFMGFTSNAGQTCMAPRRALVMRRAYAAFCDELARLVAGARRVTLVDAAAAEATHRAASAAISAGGRSIAGALEPVDGRAMRPVAVLDCPVDGDRSEDLLDALFMGRHFGPALAVRAVDSLEEAFALHARVGQYLATSIWTRHPSVDLVARAEACGSSLVHFNSVLLPSAHPAIAITGTGASGWGGSRGESGLVGLTREVFVTRTSRFVSAPLDEPSAKVQSFLSKFIAWPRAPKPASPASSRPEQQQHLFAAETAAKTQEKVHA
ncbi:MAG: aldehyde dehydrogenase family protein [Phycisphaera sp.]|nr:aldehyde dehydrogenase family protein [Phycisphaera sp.]